MDYISPSTYHDPKEVVWKHLVVQAYWAVIEILTREGIEPCEFNKIRFLFIKRFNSQHDIKELCRQAEIIGEDLIKELRQRGHNKAATLVSSEIRNTKSTLKQALQPLENASQVERGPSYVKDGYIEIAGEPAEVFANNTDFIRATLKLMREDSPHSLKIANQAWKRGFIIGDVSEDTIKKAKANNSLTADELILEGLLNEQRTGLYPSLREYEFKPELSVTENHKNKLKAIEEGYFLLGRIMSWVSLAADQADLISDEEIENLTPVEALLKQAGLTSLKSAQVEAFQRFLLIRCSHGLNPGEFTARVASSVRCTFPEALLASLLVRSGRLHAGALPECMEQLRDWIKTENKIEFVDNLICSGGFYGFGHRIHKSMPNLTSDDLGGDPRTKYLIKLAKQAFPELKDEIAILQDMAKMVYQKKPTLLPNTDFGAAIWFYCFGFSPSVGVGFFNMSRMPGLIAQIIDQLEYKANSLRPPLAANIPYTL